MKKSKLRKLTRFIVIGDTLLNWFLGIMLLLLPYKMQAFFTSSVLFSLIIWRIIGIGFIGFASFQVYSLLMKKKLNKQYYLVGAWLAILPVIGLTIALIIFNSQLKLFPKILAWTGNIYMVGLTFLYLKLTKHFK